MHNSAKLIPIRNTIKGLDTDEQRVLGCLMLACEEAPAEFSRALAMLNAEYFASDAHGFIFSVIARINEDGRVPDEAAVASMVMQEWPGPIPEKAAAYVGEIAASTGSTANSAHYARQVVTKYMRREVAKAFERGTISLPHQPVEEVVAAAIGEMTALLQVGSEGVSSKFGEVVKKTMERWEKIKSGELKKTTVAGCIPALNELLGGGYRPGELTILAARPGMGKSAFMMNEVEAVATASGKAVWVQSIEMSEDQLGERGISSMCGVDHGRVRDGSLLQADYARVAGGMAHMMGLPVMIDDSPAVTVAQINARARQQQLSGGLSMVVVDYLQLVKPANPKAPRENQVAEISRGLKGMAKNLGVPVIALSQLKRGNEERANKRPQLSDLRESGGIEADADVVVFIHREDYYEQGSDSGGRVAAELIVAKNRHGQTGMARAWFEGALTRFTPMAESKWGVL